MIDKIVEEGRQSYYDNTLRYKNPYVGDTDEAISWFHGWDSAEEEHTLYVNKKKLEEENISLREKNRTLHDERSSLVTSNLEMQFDILSIKHKLDGCRDQIDSCNILTDSLSFLSSSKRRKIKEILFDLDAQILLLESVTDKYPSNKLGKGTLYSSSQSSKKSVD